MAAVPPQSHPPAVPALAALLDRLRPGLTLEVVAECDSTSTRLLERARSTTGEPAACLLVAEHQTAGRGRNGRPWLGTPLKPGGGVGALTFSLGLPYAPIDWSGLSLAVGVALAEALGPQVLLKWPNDLCLRGSDDDATLRKLGGVLIETLPLGREGNGAMESPAWRGGVEIGTERSRERRYAVIGIGLNLDAPRGVDRPVAGWREVEPQARAHDLLLGRLAEPLLDALARFEAEGFAAPFAERFATRDALAGRVVQTAALHGQPLRGRADGIDATGALRLQTPHGLRVVHAGEVAPINVAQHSAAPC